jgi:hypothetical protein
MAATHSAPFKWDGIHGFRETSRRPADLSNEDIVAELSEDIRSQIEEQEAKLGRTLDKAEVGAILKLRGRPVLVANRYLP